MVGGAKRDRTADLLHAMQALSQLSYSPEPDENVLVHIFRYVRKFCIHSRMNDQKRKGKGTQDVAFRDPLSQERARCK
jgi:hypothetical protein